MAARVMALAAGSWDPRCPLWRVVALVEAAEVASKSPAYDDPRCQGTRRRRGQFSQNDRPAAWWHAVLLGAGFAYLQLQQQQQQFQLQQESSRKQFQEQQEESRRQFQVQQRASHDLLISNQVSKGFEQLGSDKIEIRLGGIYALEGVMNTSEEYYQPVLDALSAFVRNRTRSGMIDKQNGPPNYVDVQAVLTVIGRRIAGRVRLNLTDANAQGADLTKADLNNATLIRTNLSGAKLIGAKLIGAKLDGANLDGADLDGANLDGANLILTDLGSANLYGANLDNANLSGANLSGAKQLTQGQLDQTCGTNVKLDPPLTIKRCE